MLTPHQECQALYQWKGRKEVLQKAVQTSSLPVPAIFIVFFIHLWVNKQKYGEWLIIVWNDMPLENAILPGIEQC